MLRVDAGELRSPDDGEHRLHFDDLVPLYPKHHLRMERTPRLSTRVMDLDDALGKGQRAPTRRRPARARRALPAAEHRHSITANHPEVFLIVLLIDERLEEVTDMERSVKGEVVSSTFDEPATRHVQVAGDSHREGQAPGGYQEGCGDPADHHRLARAYNTVGSAQRQGAWWYVDSNALQRPKRFFGAARNIEGGGSLTIVATALIETGSRMDDVIFEEFKGTGNSEIVLDRKLSDKRIFPAMDIQKSGTRKDSAHRARQAGQDLGAPQGPQRQRPCESAELLVDRLGKSKTNDEFLANLQEPPRGGSAGS